jgi:hypothetical protein
LALLGATLAALQSPSAPAMGSAGTGGALSSFDTVDGGPVPPA